MTNLQPLATWRPRLAAVVCAAGFVLGAGCAGQPVKLAPVAGVKKPVVTAPARAASTAVAPAVAAPRAAAPRAAAPTPGLALPTPPLSDAAQRPSTFPLVVFPSARPTPPPPTGKLGTQAAGFRLRTPEGQVVEFPDAAGGAPTVLLFWPTWCPYSRALQPYLQAIWQDYRSAGVQLWTININETGDPVAALKARHITLPLLLEGDQVADRFGVRLTATVKVIDRHNVVVYSTGETPAEPADIARQVRSSLNSLLGSKAPSLPVLEPALHQPRQPQALPQNEWEPWVDRYLATLQPGEGLTAFAPQGEVANGKQAIALARGAWSAHFGPEETLRQAPYRSYRINDYWVVLASGTSGATAKLGEGLIAVVEVASGRVIRLERQSPASRDSSRD